MKLDTCFWAYLAICATSLGCGSTSVDPLASAGSGGQGAAGSGGQSGGSGGQTGGSGGSSGGAAGSGGSAGALEGCGAPTTAGVDRIVGCGFVEHVALLGVDQDSVYVLTAAYGFAPWVYRVDKQSGQSTLLYESNFAGAEDVERAATRFHFHDGDVFLATEGGSTDQLVRVSKNGSSSVLLEASFGDSGFVVRADATHVYTQRRVAFDTFEVFRLPRSGGAPQVLRTYQGAGDLIDVADGFLYYMEQNSIRRLPVTGGTPEVVLDELPPDGEGISDDPQNPNAVVRGGSLYYAADGDFGGGDHKLFELNPVTKAQQELYSNCDCGSGVGTLGIAVNDGVVYFKDYGWSRVDGPGEATLHYSGRTPVFDDEWAYYADVRGGGGTPYEGIVVRVKP